MWGAVCGTVPALLGVTFFGRCLAPEFLARELVDGVQCRYASRDHDCVGLNHSGDDGGGNVICAGSSASKTEIWCKNVGIVVLQVKSLVNVRTSSVVIL